MGRGSPPLFYPNQAGEKHLIEKVFHILHKAHPPREQVFREGTLKVDAPIKRLIEKDGFIYYERPFIKAFKETPIIYKQALLIPHLSIRISKLYTTGFKPYKDYEFYIDIGVVKEKEDYIEFKDLFLDIIQFIDGKITLEDADELEEAINGKWITEEEYKHAKAVAERTLSAIRSSGNISSFIEESLQIPYRSLGLFSLPQKK